LESTNLPDPRKLYLPNEPDRRVERLCTWKAAEQSKRQGRIILKNTYRAIAAVALAALVAGAATILPGVSNRVLASAPLHSGKGDRLDFRPLGTQCSEQAWPYFEASCVRDPRLAHGQAKSARIVAPDRIQLSASSQPIR
jgi:hypothetical protein